MGFLLGIVEMLREFIVRVSEFLVFANLKEIVFLESVLCSVVYHGVCPVKEESGKAVCVLLKGYVGVFVRWNMDGKFY